MDAKSLFQVSNTAVYNSRICGAITVEVIHDGLSSEFLTFSYAFGDDQAAIDNRWIEVRPTKNEHVRTYNIVLRIKYADRDYKAVFSDVNLQVEVLPCVINNVVLDSNAFSTPYTYTIIRDTRVLQEFNTKLFTYFYNCDYADEWSFTVAPSYTTH